MWLCVSGDEKGSRWHYLCSHLFLTSLLEAIQDKDFLQFCRFLSGVYCSRHVRLTQKELSTTTTCVDHCCVFDSHTVTWYTIMMTGCAQVGVQWCEDVSLGRVANHSYIYLFIYRLHELRWDRAEHHGLHGVLPKKQFESKWAKSQADAGSRVGSCRGSNEEVVRLSHHASHDSHSVGESTWLSCVYSFFFTVSPKGATKGFYRSNKDFARYAWYLSGSLGTGGWISWREQMCQRREVWETGRRSLVLIRDDWMIDCVFIGGMGVTFKLAHGREGVHDEFDDFANTWLPYFRKREDFMSR